MRRSGLSRGSESASKYMVVTSSTSLSVRHGKMDGKSSNISGLLLGLLFSPLHHLRPVLQRLGQVGHGECLRARQISNCAREIEDAVVAAI